jgi:hypothetical protein
MQKELWKALAFLAERAYLGSRRGTEPPKSEANEV